MSDSARTSLPQANPSRDFRVYTAADGTQIRLYMSERTLAKHHAQQGGHAPNYPRSERAPDAYAKVRIPKTPDEGKGFWDIRFRLTGSETGDINIVPGRMRITRIDKATRHLGTDEALLDAEVEGELTDAAKRAAIAGTPLEGTDIDQLPDPKGTTPIPDDTAYTRVEKTELLRDAKLKQRTDQAAELLRQFHDRELPKPSGQIYTLKEAYDALYDHLIKGAEAVPEHANHTRERAQTKPRGEGPRPSVEDRARRFPKHHLNALIDDPAAPVGDEPTGPHAARAAASKAAAGKRTRGDE